MGSRTAQGRRAPRHDGACRVAFRFSLQRRRPGASTFRGSIPSSPVPLSTLRRHPRGCRRMTRGRRGWLLLRRTALSSATICRSPGAQRTLDPGSHRCSSRISPNRSLVWPPLRGSARVAAVSAATLVLPAPNEAGNRSLDGALSPRLGTWPLQPTRCTALEMLRISRTAAARVRMQAAVRSGLGTNSGRGPVPERPTTMLPANRSACRVIATRVRGSD